MEAFLFYGGFLENGMIGKKKILTGLYPHPVLLHLL